jgi:hypothetical protein
MSFPAEGPRLRRATTRAVGLALAVVPLLPVEAGPRSPVSVLSTSDAAALQRLRARASERLREPECQRVLDDFTDAAGRTLRARLLQRGLSPHEQLDAITFVAGSSSGTCRSGQVLLVANPGRSVVQVCPAPGQSASRLALMEFRNPHLADFALIHEMLHTLGLGENPPSSHAITQAVKRRCQKATRRADGTR